MGSHPNSTIRCYTLPWKVVGLVAGDQTMIDGIKDEF
jgi:hypothetical protein